MTRAPDKPLCDDWSCPAGVSCALHFGRSGAYAEMRAEGRAPTRRYPRDPGADSCPEYSYDEAKPWLAIQPGQSLCFFGRWP